MTSSYMGEEELDYGDEDCAHRPSSSSSPHAMEEEDGDYDDLYSDVNVGFFPTSAPTRWEKANRGEEDRELADLQQRIPAMEAALHPGSQDGPLDGAQRPEQGGPGVGTAGQSRGHSTDRRLEHAAAAVAPGEDEAGILGAGAGAGAVAMAEVTSLREGAKAEGMMSPWDEGDCGRIAAKVPTALAPTTSYDASKASPAKVAQHHVGRGSNLPGGDGGNTRLLVGDLHWWTTDTELEAALSEYGRIKNLKFFEERASGKSKGYCELEFYDSSAARACKEGMGGRDFNGKPCVVTYATSYAFRQLSKMQSPATFNQGRRTNADGGAMVAPSQGGKAGTSGRGHGPGSGRMGQGTSYRGRGGLGVRNMGLAASSYGQGSTGTLAGRPIPLQNIMGQAYDPTYGSAMGRVGSSYGAYMPRGLAFGGMALTYPTMGPGGLPGVAPHVNPAFFGRGASMNGIGMLAGTGVEGGWGEASLNSWGGDVHDQRIGESNYGEESGGADCSYGGDISHERGRMGVVKDRDKGRDGESGSYGERRYREDRDVHWEKQKLREVTKDWDWEEEDLEKERHARVANKPRTVVRDEQGTGSREEDYGKRRRMAR